MGAARDLSTGNIRCTACDEVKPLGDFYVTSSGRPGSWCKKCRKDKQSAWKANNPAKVSVYRHRGHIKSEFGLTPELFDSLYGTALKIGLCEVCKRPEVNDRRLAVDHDHKTGALRGLICTRCNSALGFVEDNQQLLYALIMYLEHYKSAPRGFARPQRKKARRHGTQTSKTAIGS